MKRKQLIMYSIIGLIAVTAGYYAFQNHSDRSSADGYVTYRIDEANTCSWQNGRIGETTLVMGPRKTIEVKRSEESAFLKKAADTSLCAYKL